MVEREGDKYIRSVLLFSKNELLPDLMENVNENNFVMYSLVDIYTLHVLLD